MGSQIATRTNVDDALRAVLSYDGPPLTLGHTRQTAVAVVAAAVNAELKKWGRRCDATERAVVANQVLATLFQDAFYRTAESKSAYNGLLYDMERVRSVRRAVLGSAKIPGKGTATPSPQGPSFQASSADGRAVGHAIVDAARPLAACLDRWGLDLRLRGQGKFHDIKRRADQNSIDVDANDAHLLYDRQWRDAAGEFGGTPLCEELRGLTPVPERLGVHAVLSRGPWDNSKGLGAVIESACLLGANLGILARKRELAAWAARHRVDAAARGMWPSGVVPRAIEADVDALMTLVTKRFDVRWPRKRLPAPATGRASVDALLDALASLPRKEHLRAIVRAAAVDGMAVGRVIADATYAEALHPSRSGT